MSTTNLASNRRRSKNRSKEETGEPTNVDPSQLQTPNNKKRSKRRSSTGIKDRIWEKKQLQNINIQVDNIFSHWPDGTDNTKMNSELERLRKECDRKIDRANLENQKKLADLNSGLEDEKAINRKNSDRIAELENELKDAQKKAKDANNKYKREKADFNNLQRDFNKLKKDNSNKIENLQAKVDDLEEQNAELRALNGKLSKNYEQLRKELNLEYQQKLLDAMNEKDKNLQKLKAQMEDQHHLMMEDLQNQFGKEIDDLQNERDKLLERVQELAQKNRDLQAERNEIKLNLEAIKQDLENEQEKHRETKDKLENQYNKKNDEFKELHDAYNRLNQDYFIINDIKVELETEIEKLKKKLDMFEQKHGIESPFKRPKKRRRLNDNTIILDSLESEAIANKFPLVISKRQFDGEWTGFEIQNIDERDIKMEDWYLTDENNKHKLELPNYKLKPNDRIRIILNGEKIDMNDLVWTYKFGKKHKSKDLVLIIHDKHGHSREFDRVPPNQRHDVKANQSCFVM